MCKHVFLSVLHIYLDKHYYQSVPDNPNFCFCKMCQLIKKNYKWQNTSLIFFKSRCKCKAKHFANSGWCWIFGQSQVLSCHAAVFCSAVLSFSSPQLPASSLWAHVDAAGAAWGGEHKKGFITSLLGQLCWFSSPLWSFLPSSFLKNTYCHIYWFILFFICDFFSLPN